jgi:serine/threonine protein kinase
MCTVSAVDMWACGVCLYTMLTGCPLYEGPDDSAFELLAMGKTADLIRYYATYGAFLEPTAQALVCRMLQPRPADRPSLEEVLRDPWMC